MRHPFDGIIVPHLLAEQPATSRRAALTLLVGAGAASLVAGVADAQPPAPSSPEKEADTAPAKLSAAARQKYHLYYVVPKEVRRFDARRRMDLNFQSEMLPGLPLHKELGDTPGFLAWFNDEQTAQVKAADDVTLAHQIVPDDVMVQGTPPKRGVAMLRVFAVPLGWRTPPARDTYLELVELGDLWSSKFAMKDGVAVIINHARQLFIQFAPGKMHPDVIDTLKSQPQVYALQWLTPVGGESTEKFGEEGGVGATTGAIREEGGTTSARNEEGGVTTGRRGEDGDVSTLARGEEGGVSTLRRGEEGGEPPMHERL